MPQADKVWQKAFIYRGAYQRENQKMSTPGEAFIVKARLRNFGEGTLDLNDGGIKFYAKTGRFRKRREIAREISIAEIEGVEKQGNDLTIAWKGTTDMFVIEQTSQLEIIYEKISTKLTERKVEQEKETTANQKRNEIAQTTIQAIDTADPLFRLLNSLHGHVDWKLLESICLQAEEEAGKLSGLNTNPIHLDLKPTSTAVKERRPKETAERAYDVLKTLYQHFDDTSSLNDGSEKDHPNQHDSNLAVQAIYILNDLELSAVVGDEEIEKETSELLKVLDELSKVPGSKIDVNSIKISLETFRADKEKKPETLENIKSSAKQHFNEIINPKSTTAQQPT